METFQTFDWIVVLAYFLVVMGIAWWVIKQKQQTTADYFLASRHIGWFVIGASIFASNIGSEHVVGLAGTAAQSGFVMGHYELHSWIVLLLGWVFVPFYMRSSVFTMPEFLEKRYSSTARWFLSLISLVGYVLTKVSVTVYAGAVVFQTLMGVEFWTGALIIVILTGVYTTLGGLRAVVYTDTLQSIVLVIGAVIMTTIGLVKIGGWNELVNIIGAGHFNMFLPANHPEFPWVGMVLAPPIAERIRAIRYSSLYFSMRICSSSVEGGPVGIFRVSIRINSTEYELFSFITIKIIRRNNKTKLDDPTL